MKHLYSLVFVLIALTSFNLSIAQNIIPNVTYTNDNTSTCSGTATASATGGAGGYVYMWSNGATGSSIGGLCAGSYYVIIQDANQDTASFSFTITNPCSNLVLSASATNCTPGNCDGSVQLTVTGGSGPYSFSLAGGSQTGQSLFSNLCPGTYTATVVDVNGCSAVATVTVTDPSLSTITPNLTTVDAFGGNCSGSASVSPSGGTAPYSVYWSTGQTGSSISNLCMGTYSVTIWDATGTDTTTVNFTILDPCVGFTGTVSSTPASGPGICDGSVTFTPIGGTAPYTYSWNNGATTQSMSNLCSGNYTAVCIDANGCMSTQIFFVNNNPCSTLTGTFTATPTSGPAICDGSATFTPIGGTAPYTYSWSNGVTTPSLSNLCSGYYTVTCTDSNGCIATLTVSVSDSSNTIGNLYVNLTSTDDLTNNCSGSASVSPSGGIAPYTVLWSDGQSGTSASNLCAGIYSVMIWDSGSDSTTINFVIADSSSTYGNNPFPNGVINDTLYTDLVTNCIIDYNVIDSATLYQAVYDSINQNLYVTWAIYSPTDTVYISDTLGLAGNPGYYSITISVYCPNKSGNDFFKIESVIYFDGSTVWLSPTLGLNEQELLDKLSIYPNPFSNSIWIDNKDAVIQSMKLIDLNGRVLSEMNQVNSGLVKMDQLEMISAGTYLLVLSGNNTSKAYKVIK